MSDVQDADPRVVKLETHFEYIRRDLDQIERKVVGRDEIGKMIADSKSDILKGMFGAIGFQTFVVLAAVFGAAAFIK